MVSRCQGAPPCTASPAHRSTTGRPPTVTATLAPTSRPSLKFCANASRTGANRGSKLPWISMQRSLSAAAVRLHLHRLAASAGVDRQRSAVVRALALRGRGAQPGHLDVEPRCRAVGGRARRRALRAELVLAHEAALAREVDEPAVQLHPPVRPDQLPRRGGAAAAAEVELALRQ